MKLVDMKELFDKVNDGSVDRYTAAEVTVDLARFTDELLQKYEGRN